MRKIFSFAICFCAFHYSMNAQSDFSSPYSLYGLGQENSNYFGGFSALGNTGIASRNLFTINKSNPASLTSIASGAFLYELGINTTYSNKKTSTTSQDNFDFNISHLAMAFEVKDYWKMSLGLVPYSKVSYEIDVNQPIEGTSQFFNTNVIGSGGINEVFWGNGLKLTKNLSVGVELSTLFGNISKEQLINFGDGSATITNTSNYIGFGLNAGIQYTVNKLIGTETTIGATINLPTSLNGTTDEVGTKSFTGSDEISIINDIDTKIDNFDLPLKIGIGITSKINKNLTVNLDYKNIYWTDTYKSNNTYIYKDQEIYGFGLEYQSVKNISSFWNRVKYRAGANYNSGYLILSKQNIDNYSFSLGLGIPVSKSEFSSMVNINYSYGKEGTINNKLIQDNFHKLSLNFSLLGNWFQKEKIF
ncbi:hypothetical protein [uncultured Lutibacter sp.]|uniref:OmpP1/FadL family transporter n=1 Tax=uncultured Lutibacter sp. TaxID=437739 RepID=UPI00261BE935|nr:hypothetical protein [uncultured Lutibacter sp.]